MFNHWWIIGLLVVVLIIFGPGKLPQIGGAVGSALREFRKATTELRDEVSRHTDSPVEPAAGTVTAPPVPLNGPVPHVDQGPPGPVTVEPVKDSVSHPPA